MRINVSFWNLGDYLIYVSRWRTSTSLGGAKDF